MRWPCVSRRRHEDEVAKLRSRVLATEARHDEAARAHNQLAKKLADEKTANRHLAEELQAVSIVNARLTEDLVKEREVSGSLALQIHAMAQPVEPDLDAADWPAKYEAEKRRADRLQRQYDDAVGLSAGRIEDSSRWQPGYEDSKSGAAPRGSGVSS